MSVRIGDLLIEEQRITLAQLEEARALQAAHGGDLGAALARLGHVTDEEATVLLGTEHGVPSIDLSRFDVDAGVIALIPAETARKYRVVPLTRSGATLIIAMSDPRNVLALDDIKFMTGCNVEPAVASEVALSAALARYYEAGAAGDGSGSAPRDGEVSPRGRSLDAATRQIAGMPAAGEDDRAGSEAARDAGVVTLEPRGGDPPAVRLVNMLLAAAIERGASDIHIEPYDKQFRVRFRIDGVLHHVMTPPMRLRDAITSRFKVMAKLDIAEKRLPQDGRIRIRGAAKTIDLRVSCLPTLFGEKIALRLLDKAHLMLDMTRLGFEPESLCRFEASIRKPWGMVLVTGPTGSGKTNTLYSAIARLNTPATNILTVEDPVEFNLGGINQVQVRDRIGLSFATALRAFLRQDPNVILVGEIRDVETAAIAVKAALTGHLVLSTLHTNDAPSTVHRLMDMGIEPFLVAGSVNLICAQRLVRRVCAGCAEPHAMSPAALADLGFSGPDAGAVIPRRGCGCDACSGTGYKGRVGLYEVMEVTDAVRELILDGGSSRALRRTAIDEGMITLRQSGLRKIAHGVTSVDEVTRETVP